MSFQERVYSVLLVSASQAVNSALKERLQPSLYSPVRVEQSVTAASRAFSEQAYDIVIVNSPLPDDAGIRFAIDVNSRGDSAVLLLIGADFFEEVSYRVGAQGVFTLQKPTAVSMLAIALHWLTSARELLRKTERKTLSVEEKMEEIRLVNRAKWILIEQRGIDEPAAHRYIEKTAMDRCVSRRAIAEEILNGNP